MAYIPLCTILLRFVPNL